MYSSNETERFRSKAMSAAACRFATGSSIRSCMSGLRPRRSGGSGVRRFIYLTSSLRRSAALSFAVSFGSKSRTFSNGVLTLILPASIAPAVADNSPAMTRAAMAGWSR